MRREFEKQKEALLKEVRSVLNDVEELTRDGVERGSEEGKALRAKLQNQLERAQDKMHAFEDEAVERVKHHAKQADDLVQEKPYYAMGFAALAGLVVGVLLNRR